MENLYALFFIKNGGKSHGRNKLTMTTEETQGEPAAKENETKAEKFIRIGEYRMNKAWMSLADWKILRIVVPMNTHRNR